MFNVVLCCFNMLFKSLSGIAKQEFDVVPCRFIICSFSVSCCFILFTLPLLTFVALLLYLTLLRFFSFIPGLI